ncbi:MAG: hypothetical protein IT437_03710 [Phycisphaerales bacterium]|nr:hypothetical protein [Phycisphaerales bacterium]
MPPATTQTDLCRAHVALGLLGILRALESTRLLPPGHPGTIRAASAAAEDLLRALTNRAALTVTVTAATLLLDGEDTDERNLLRPLAEHLHALDLVAIDFRPGLTAQTVLDLAAALSEAQRERWSGMALADAVNRRVAGLRVVAADYSALRLARGAGAGGSTKWQDFARGVVGSLRAAGEREVLAAAARASGELHDPICAGAVQEHLRQALRFGSGEDPAQAEATVASVRKFVEALTPEARLALTRIDPEGPERSLDLLADLADVLPTEDVLTALTEGSGKHRLSLHAMRLFNKMARVATDRPDQMARVKETMERWRAANMAAGGLQDSLAEVFHTRSKRDYMPDDYRARLAGLASRPLEGPDSTFTAMVDRRPQLHAAEVAVLVARECRGIDCRGVYEYLRKATATLVQEGRLPVVLDAFDAARTLAGDEATRESADEFLGEVRSPRLLAEALRVFPEAPESAEAISRLLEVIGAPALEVVLTTLAAHPTPAQREVLTEFLAGAGAEALAAALRSRLEADPASVGALEPQLRALGPLAVISALEPVLRSGSEVTRRGGYSAAASILNEWPVDLIERALRQPDGLLHALAFEKLSRRHDPASLTLLASLVARRGGYPVDAAIADRAASVLINEGLAGLRLLSDALRLLCGEVAPSKAAAARALARMLAPHSGERCVRIALIRWRWCVARLVSAVLRGKA